MKKRYIVLIVILVAVVAQMIMFGEEKTKDESMDLIESSDNIEIRLSKTEMTKLATPKYDIRFEMYEKGESGFEEYAVAKQPKGVSEWKEFFQVNKYSGEKKYDQIYTWQTEKYNKVGQSALRLNFNCGLNYVAQDRGYMELSYFKGEPLRIYAKGLYPSSINGIKCYVNRELELSSDKYKMGCYEALIEDIDEQGTDALLIANNVSQQYFVGLLKWTLGGDYPDLEKGLKGKNAKVASSVQNEIKAYLKADEFGYKQLPKDDIIDSEELWVCSTKVDDQKDYNFVVEAYVKGKYLKTFYLDIKNDEGKAKITKWVEGE